MNKQIWLLPLLAITTLMWSEKVLAHASHVQYRQTQAVEIEASYDDGTPMANAQVIVYAPDDPATPWLKGTTDSEGKFIFVPDASIPGNWDVTVRQAGHGNIVNIPWGEENAASDTASGSSADAGYTPLQKVVMAAVGVWGFVGTALFFSRHKPQN
ncbi:carboxypeptidase regulatory-like domain-containing protein [Pleurocapsales cyanobacterium LEGE 06147]|nr:carboxypeptidase regulatory-like domain-containing protein [Pleurocapsales cyanobacterium LEGE 06147]